jgi:putative photosynthetic complex assembly protein
VRERRSHGLGMEHPFRIARYPDGRLVLEDLATDRVIDLQAFGPTNAGAFARLLAAPPSET